MTIAGLQKHFRDLGEFVALTAAGSKAAADLTAVASALDPFRSLTVEQFGGFLRAAGEYHRTGAVPVPVPVPEMKPMPDRPAVAAPAAPKASNTEIANRVIDLYNRAADPTLTNAALEEDLKQVDALKGESLAIVIKALSIVKSNKPADRLRQEVRTAIRNRHGIPARTQI